jgi:hypothetical protein
MLLEEAYASFSSILFYFKISKKNLYLVYSNVGTNILPADAFVQLQTKLNSWCINEASIVRRDQNLYCFFNLSEKCDIRESTYLDLVNLKGETLSGAYKINKSRSKFIELFLMDFKYYVPTREIFATSNMSFRISKKRGYENHIHEHSTMLAIDGKVFQSLTLLKAHFSKDHLENFLENNKSLEKSFLDQLIKSKRVSVDTKSSGFKTPFGLTDFLELNSSNELHQLSKLSKDNILTIIDFFFLKKILRII